MKHIEQLYEEHIANKANDSIYTNLSSLDAILGGLGKGELVTIAGRPCNGRIPLVTSLISNITINKQIPTAVFCFNLQKQEFINYLLANVSGIAYDKLKKDTPLSNEEADSIMDCWKDRIKIAPLYIGGFKSLGITEITNSIKKLIAEYGIRIVFITYLQLIENISEDYQQIAKQLKWLAKEMGITIVVTSTLNWKMEEREGVEGKIPLLTDLRYVGDLDEFSDIVIGVFRPASYQIYYDMRGNDLHDVLVLMVLKNGEEANNEVLTMNINNKTLAVTDDNEIRIKL